MGKSTFMKQVPITLQAILGIDLKNQKYTFKQNKATVNRLDLVFEVLFSYWRKDNITTLLLAPLPIHFKTF